LVAGIAAMAAAISMQANVSVVEANALAKVSATLVGKQAEKSSTLLLKQGRILKRTAASPKACRFLTQSPHPDL
jgi:hypothetical protein